MSKKQNKNIIIVDDNNNKWLFYQRYCCINQILHNKNYEYILEEGYEDIIQMNH
jgi:hypothetical protein